MKTKPFLTTSLLLVTILAFVYFAQPIYAKANSSDLTYIETSDSTQDVVELFSGVELFIPVAITIIGFIAMCYCTLRNVDIPFNYTNSTSFFDKCSDLGQYIINNATDPIKNFLYSVYTYCQDNNITSITGIAAFVAKNAAQFFVSLSKWFNSSFISDVNETSEGFLNLFNDFSVVNSLAQFNYISEVESIFNSKSPVLYSNTIGWFDGYYWGYHIDALPANATFFAISVTSSSFSVDLYSAVSQNSFVRIRIPATVYYMKYSNTADHAPDLVSYYVDSFSTGVISRSGNLSNTFFDINQLLGYLSLFGLPIYGFDYVIGDTLQTSDLTLKYSNDVFSTPASDQVYYPALDWTIDLWRTWDDVADGVDSLTDKMRAFVGDISLTLDSALANTNVIQGGGEYVFPSMDGIWKYPQYFFDTLKGWGLFVGGCLNAVTVGEGGLSWLFYGGFIIIVCGGIIGKILLG